MKVKIDINEPIKRGTHVKIGSKEDTVWIPITFEKLPDFCYYCGKLGHVMQDCDEEGVEAAVKTDYGLELRETQSSKGVYRGYIPKPRGRDFWGRGRGRGDRG